MRSPARSTAALGLLLFCAAPTATVHASPGAQLKLRSVASEEAPEPSDAARAHVPGLLEKIEAEPRERAHRFALVKAYRDAGMMAEALQAARDWREHDAYNLVAVRMLGDLLTEAGLQREALRTYSAVTELLAEDAGAQRSLASVLKQQGRMDAARERLERAVQLAPEDARLRLELADVQLRSHRSAEALSVLETLIADPSLPEGLRHPTTARLAQVYAAQRKAASEAGNAARASELGRKLDGLEVAGGRSNDIRVYLSWDTDRSDVDLWVTTPSGEKIFYSHKQGARGEALHHDITNGYGPETLTVPRAEAGEYKIEVNYFGSGRSGFSEARGELTVILNEGRADETLHRLPYRLHQVKQTLHVASVEVSK